MDHDGYLTQAELERVMTQLVCWLRTLLADCTFLLMPLCTF